MFANLHCQLTRIFCIVAIKPVDSVRLVFLGIVVTIVAVATLVMVVVFCSMKFNKSLPKKPDAQDKEIGMDNIAISQLFSIGDEGVINSGK